MPQLPCRLARSRLCRAALFSLSLVGVASAQVSSGVPSDPNAVAGQPVEDKGVTVHLSPFEVSATSEEDGYATKSTGSSARVALDYLDTAQTVSVINKQFISDNNIQDTRLLFQDMPNVYAGSTDQSSRLWIRGVEVDSIYIDGVLGSQNAALPLQFYDRVELVRGPSSSAFGVGQPGGIINFTTKMPTGRTDGTFEVGFGDHRSYLFNLDTEGSVAKNKFGQISYRFVPYYERGGYQILGEYHRGAGALLSLRDDITDTLHVEVALQYSDTEFPLTDNNTLLYQNQTAYSWLMAQFGAAGNNNYPALPNSNPFPGGTAGEQGNWAGGTLMPKGFTGFANEGFGPEQYTKDFRGSIAIEKSFFNNALTLRNTATVETGHQDGYYITGGSFAYLNPATNQPFTTVGTGLPFPKNTYIGTIEQLGESPFPYGEFFDNDHRAENLDAAFKYHVLGGEWNIAAGADAYTSGFTNNSYSYTLTNPDGSPLWINILNPGNNRVNVEQHPATQGIGTHAFGYAWGEYIDGRLSYFDDRITVEAGDRWDTGGSTTNDFLHHSEKGTGALHSNGAPRYSITIKPLKWLSLYALRAEHNDPASLVQRYSLFNPGTNLAALNAKYNNFNNPFTYSPAGVLKEFGVKSELLNGAITFSADFFEFNTSSGTTTQIITDNNPASPTYNSVVVENFLASNHAKGGEVEAAGRVGRHLIFTAAYGITRGRFANFADGNPNWINPPSTTALHGKWDIGVFHNLDFYVMGGGTRFGPFLAAQDPYIFYTTAQYVWDGGFGVKWNGGRQSIEAYETDLGRKIPFISPQTAYAQGTTEQAYIKYKMKF